MERSMIEKIIFSYSLPILEQTMTVFIILWQLRNKSKTFEYLSLYDVEEAYYVSKSCKKSVIQNRGSVSVRSQTEQPSSVIISL